MIISSRLRDDNFCCCCLACREREEMLVQNVKNRRRSIKHQKQAKVTRIAALLQ